MTLFITLTLAEADTGPFNIYSDIDGFLSAFATNVPKASLLAGYSANSVPDGTTILKLKSTGVCTNFTYLNVFTTTTTTTTTL